MESLYPAAALVVVWLAGLKILGLAKKPGRIAYMSRRLWAVLGVGAILLSAIAGLISYGVGTGGISLDSWQGDLASEVERTGTKVLSSCELGENVYAAISQWTGPAKAQGLTIVFTALLRATQSKESGFIVEFVSDKMEVAFRLSLSREAASVAAGILERDGWEAMNEWLGENTLSVPTFDAERYRSADGSIELIVYGPTYRPVWISACE